jgi:dUTPase
MSTIKFLMIRDVKYPSRANSTDAGIDFYVPKFNNKFKEDLLNKNEFLKVCSKYKRNSTDEFTATTFKDPFLKDKENKHYFELKPQERILIPSGIKYKMEEEGRALIAFNKSGVASKLGLLSGACICDYSYQGEVHINLVNTSNDVVRIYEDQKIIQFIEVPIFTSEILFVNDETTLFENVKTNRGSGGFGSSDNK